MYGLHVRFGNSLTFVLQATTDAENQSLGYHNAPAWPQLQQQPRDYSLGTTPAILIPQPGSQPRGLQYGGAPECAGSMAARALLDMG